MFNKMKHGEKNHTNNLFLVYDRVIRNGYDQKYYFWRFYQSNTFLISPEIAISLKAKSAKFLTMPLETAQDCRSQKWGMVNTRRANSTKAQPLKNLFAFNQVAQFATFTNFTKTCFVEYSSLMCSMSKNFLWTHLKFQHFSGEFS